MSSNTISHTRYWCDFCQKEVFAGDPKPMRMAVGLRDDHELRLATAMAAHRGGMRMNDLFLEGMRCVILDMCRECCKNTGLDAALERYEP